MPKPRKRPINYKVVVWEKRPNANVVRYGLLAVRSLSTTYQIMDGEEPLGHASFSAHAAWRTAYNFLQSASVVA